VAEICQNRTADKDQFFRGFSVAQIKKCKTNESLDITWGICIGNRRSKRYSENFHKFYGATPKSVSGQQLPQILPHSN
jgi:ribosomal protein L13E